MDVKWSSCCHPGERKALSGAAAAGSANIKNIKNSVIKNARLKDFDKELQHIVQINTSVLN